MHRKPLKKVQLQNKAQEGKSVRCTPTLSTHLALGAIIRVVFSALRGRWACYVRDVRDKESTTE